MSRAERRARREERQRQRELLGGVTPPAVVYPPSTDQLQVFDRHENDTHHALRDLWRPAASFLVGGGPSLNEVDTSLLASRGIASLGINNVAAHVPVKAFCCSDPPEKFHHAIWFDPGVMKFVPRPKLKKRVRAKIGEQQFRFTQYRVADCPNVWGFHRTAEFVPEEFLTSTGATWGNNSQAVEKNGRPKILFTFFCALRLMHYLGCRRVYLLGVDFHMHAGRNGGYAFKQNRWASSVGGNNDHYRIASRMLAELQPYFAAANFQVFNCYEYSGLKVFPYVPFDEAIEDCRGMVPKEIDLAGWYEKPGEQYQEDRGDE